MLRVLTFRLAGMLPTALLVVAVVFLLIHMVPGDPVDVLLGERALPADREALRASLGLDLPMSAQFARYLGGLVQGDWGTSMVSGKPVLGLLAERLPATGWLSLWAMIVAVGLGAVGGVLACRVFSGRVAPLADGASLAAMAVPTFVVGPLLIVVVSVQWGILPVSGNDGWASVVLPAVTLGLGLGAVLARMTAASLRSEAGADYVRTVRAKGGSERLALRHAFRNALLPVVQIFFLQLGMVLTGTVLTEAVFGWPGVGNLLVEALQQRDYPVIQGCLLLISLVYMVSLLLADAASAWLDPRVRGAK